MEHPMRFCKSTTTSHYNSLKTRFVCVQTTVLRRTMDSKSSRSLNATDQSTTTNGATGGVSKGVTNNVTASTGVSSNRKISAITSEAPASSSSEQPLYLPPQQTVLVGKGVQKVDTRERSMSDTDISKGIRGDLVQSKTFYFIGE